MEPATTPAAAPLQTSNKRRLEVAMLALLPLAVLGFGAVHAWPRLGLALAAALIGWMLWRKGRVAPDRLHRGLFAVTITAIALSAVPFIPVDDGWRAVLQPGIASPVTAALDLVGAGARPLALDPHRGLIEWALGAGLVLLGWGAAVRVTRAARAWRITWACVGTGVALVGLALVERWTGATSILWITDVPSVVREPFFGTFVNTNHGGALCAALIPMSVAMAAIGPAQRRSVGLLCAATLSGGVVAAGSRGALLAAVVGVGTVLLLAGGPRTRRVVLIAVGTLVLAVLVGGPEASLRALGAVVAPEVGEMVDRGYVDLTTGRQALLAEVWTLAKGVWVLGVGSAGFDDAYRVIKTSPSFNISSHAHNELLQIVVEHGVVVALLWVAAAIAVARIAIHGAGVWAQRPDRRWLIAGFAGSLGATGLFAMVDFPMRVGAHGVLAAITAGSIVGLARRRGTGVSPGPLMRGSLIVLMLSTLACGLAVLIGAWSPAGPFGSPGTAIHRLNDPELAIRRQPVNRRALQRLARTRVESGDHAAAAQILEVATGIYPSLPWLWRDRARLARQMGDEAQARAAWTRLMVLDLPERHDPLPLVREAIFGAGDDAPIDVARQVLPERGDRWRQAARLFAQLDMRADAEALFQRALQLDPSGVAHFASALLRWGRPDEALALVGPKPEDCARRRIRSSALLDLGRYDEAVDSFRATLTKCGVRDWALRAGLGRARLRSGDDRGVDSMSRLIAERPQAHGLRRALIRFLAATGRPSQAAPHLEHLILSGVASRAERAAFARAAQGLPIRTSELTGKTR
jgi:tetratricopeptide (TPR) repeat protein